MSQINFYDIFNTKLLEFMNELKTTFVDVKDFEFYDNLTRTCIMMSKEIPLNIFKASVEGPFGDKIDKKDECFILEQKFDNTNESFVNILKVVWKDLDESNKEHVWKHVQLLLAISRKMVK